MNNADHALELRGVCAAYGTIDVLRGVDVAVPFGSVVALLGPNGGGKSTMLRVVAGQLAATAGDVFIAGRRVNGAAPDELARRGVCLIPEGRGIFPNLSVRENLWMVTYTGASRAEIEQIAFARFPRLANKRDQLAGTLSGGEQQPIVVEQLYEIVGEIAQTGVSLLVVEQFARAVLRIADWVGIMSRGRVVAYDRPTAIEAQLSTAYLGD